MYNGCWSIQGTTEETMISTSVGILQQLTKLSTHVLLEDNGTVIRLTSCLTMWHLSSTFPGELACMSHP
jgi:hypothetical protein